MNRFSVDFPDNVKFTCCTTVLRSSKSCCRNCFPVFYCE